MPDRGRPGSGTRRGSVAVALALVLAGCAGTPPADRRGGDPSGTITVFAAASLTDAFEALEAAFVDAHPGSEAVFNHAGSQVLAGQIMEGAPADVFASANPRHMAAVRDGGHVSGQPRAFATNELAIVVEPDNPLGIDGLHDLSGPDLVVVLPAEEVPAGDYARTVLADAGVDVAPASLEPDVRAALSKVALGEADASIVYSSDVVAADDRVTGVEIPPDVNVTARYPIAVMADAPNPAGAEAFVDFVLSDEGQAILSDHGFVAP